jgi:hypothetical protein
MKTKACLSVVTLSLVSLLVACALTASAQEPVAAQPTTSAIPNLIRYGGVLKDADGAVLASQTIGVTFGFYKQQNGGVALWTETRNVSTDAAGQFNVMLGSTKTEGVPAELFSDQEQRWLSVQVQGQPERARVLLVSVPYAFKAHEAETLGGLPASAFVKAAPDATSSGFADSGITVNGLKVAGKTGSTTNSGQVQPPTVSDCLTPQLGAITMWSKQIQVSPPIWEICNSNLFQDPTTGYIGIGPLTGGPSKPLDVGGTGTNAGEINARKWYDIGYPETRILSVTTNPATAVPFPGSTNLFVGWQAGDPGIPGLPQRNGNLNTFTGFQSGYNQGSNSNSLSPGSANTYNGTYSGWSNINGVSNTMLGANAGFTNLANYNTCVGSSACQKHKNGDGNTMVGNSAGLFDATGTLNSFFGDAAGLNNVGNFNTFLGDRAGANNRGNNNTFSGYQSGFNNTVDNNVFYGYQSGMSNTTGYHNTFIGYQSGMSNTNSGFGVENTFIGYQAGKANTDSAGNTFVGSLAGLVSGSTIGAGSCCNTFLGFSAGAASNTAKNTLLGYKAGIATTGRDNTLVGSFVGASNVTGDANVFVGADAGLNNKFGSYNTYMGKGAGGNSSTSTSENSNIVIGYFAGSVPTNATSNIEIGSEGAAGDNNTIRIGNLNLNTNYFTQNRVFIEPIVANPLTTFTLDAVTIDNFGQLGHKPFPTGGGGVTGNCGLGVNYLAKWVPPFVPPTTTVDCSRIWEDPTSPYFVGIGTTTPGVQLDVNGDINAKFDNSSYRIGLSPVLQISGTENLFVGVSAGLVNTGKYNTFMGFEAGKTHLGGDFNIFVGNKAGSAEVASNNNIEIGNTGPSPETPTDSQILIGDKDVHKDTYVAGIYSALAGTAGPFQSVCVDSNGKLWGNPGPNDCDGTPHHLPATVVMPLQEGIQTLSQQVKAQQQEIERLKAQLQLQNAAFHERLSRLESLVTTRIQTAAADKPTPSAIASGSLQQQRD